MHACLFFCWVQSNNYHGFVNNWRSETFNKFKLPFYAQITLTRLEGLVSRFEKAFLIFITIKIQYYLYMYRTEKKKYKNYNGRLKNQPNSFDRHSVCSQTCRNRSILTLINVFPWKKNNLARVLVNTDKNIITSK